LKNFSGKDGSAPIPPRKNWPVRPCTAIDLPDSLDVFLGPTSTGKEERRRKCKGEGRYREGFGPSKNFGVLPPMVYGPTEP